MEVGVSYERDTPVHASRCSQQGSGEDAMGQQDGSGGPLSSKEGTPQNVLPGSKSHHLAVAVVYVPYSYLTGFFGAVLQKSISAQLILYYY